LIFELVSVLVFIFVEISFILIFRDYYLLKQKIELTIWFVCGKEKKIRKISAGFFNHLWTLFELFGAIPV